MINILLYFNIKQFFFVEIEGLEEEDRENDKVEEILNELVFEKKVGCYFFSIIIILLLQGYGLLIQERFL